MPKLYNRDTFFESTIASFTPCKAPKCNPDYWSFSGSSYWYIENGVIRLSDHWGIVGSCFWLINWECSRKYMSGFANWKDFKSAYIHTL